LILNLGYTMSIVFRYLASHWYESLRDACFLASPPNKFNDFLIVRLELKGTYQKKRLNVILVREIGSVFL
jgi:hypothetical protein